jgi:hypothetical protein
MKTAVIVEGVGEYKGLPHVIEKLRNRSKNTHLRPVRIAVSPNSPPAKIARECVKAMKVASALGATRAVLLIDREQVQRCPGEIASELEAEIERQYGSSLPVSVVIKDRSFENWLIADLQALRSQPARYSIKNSHVGKVEPNKADGCAALKLLNSAALKDPFHKIDDAARICERMDVSAAARNSRSFRHFLHVMGDPEYGKQCRRPA